MGFRRFLVMARVDEQTVRKINQYRRSVEKRNSNFGSNKIPSVSDVIRMAIEEFLARHLGEEELVERGV